jgi:hypothetical protein
MRCDECQGEGFKPIGTVVRTSEDKITLVRQYVVCPECQGCGIVSCCEGAERFGQIGSSAGRG